MNRKNLVIVRAGENSLHSHWLNATEARNWDLIVSFYGHAQYQALADEKVVRIKGGKFDGLFKTIESFPNLLSTYDYVWLPDDDILTCQSDINELFRLARTHNLAVCQPSLSWKSYYSHLLTLNSPSFALRYVNMVEVMVPCLETSLLKKVLPYFEGKMTCWGMDFIWCRLEDDNIKKSAVLDQLQFTHTRPIGVFLESKVRGSGQNSFQDMNNLLARFSHPKNFAELQLNYGGIFKNQRVANSKFTVQLFWLLDMLRFQRQARTHSVMVIKIIKQSSRFIFNSFFRRANLTKLVDKELLQSPRENRV